MSFFANKFEHLVGSFSRKVWLPPERRLRHLQQSKSNYEISYICQTSNSSKGH